MSKYIRRKHSVFNLGYHFIISSKYRKPYFLNYSKELKRAFRYSSIKMNILIEEINIMPDHIHLFIKCLTNKPLSKIVQHLKGYSSYIIRKKYSYLKKFKSFYSPSYFIESIGNMNKQVIQKYIRNQKINLKPNYKYKHLIEKFKVKSKNSVSKKNYNKLKNININKIDIFKIKTFKTINYSIDYKIPIFENG